MLDCNVGSLDFHAWVEIKSGFPVNPPKVINFLQGGRCSNQEWDGKKGGLEEEGARQRSAGVGSTWPRLKTVLVSHFGIGEFTTHCRTF